MEHLPMKTDKPKSLAVIGGGASGLAAAIFAAREAENKNIKIAVTIFELNSRVGKKILVSGNGRCNFTNTDLSVEHYHGSGLLAKKCIEKFDNNDICRFFEEFGLLSRTDFAGRVYPLSNQATAVLDVFRTAADAYNIKIKTDCRVDSIKKQGSAFIINSSEKFDSVILACGGRASAVHGSDGAGFPLLKALGVSVTPLCPALTALNVIDFTKSLKGIRAEGEITIKQSGRIIAKSCGEIQYTDYGLSGIPAMQVSGETARALSKNEPVFAFVDSAPTVDADTLKNIIASSIKNFPSQPNEMLLSGIMPKRLGMYLLSELSFKPEKSVKSINLSAVDNIVTAIKKKKYRVLSVRGFADAQVTAGGVPENEINPDTMELKKVANMFVCGETVDVDGECGGYNLQWAWSSAYVAAISAVKELTDASNK